MFLVSLSIDLIVSGKDCGNDGWTGTLGDLLYAEKSRSDCIIPSSL